MTADVWVIVDVPPATARAMPKSITLTAPVVVSITLAGLMSRCTMPLRWLKSSAEHTSAVISMARSGCRRPSSASTSLRVRPSTYSMTMNGSGTPSALVSSPVS